ncbi:MAG: hypothetical protein ACREBU_14750 [Nitrososphaera sp.]
MNLIPRDLTEIAVIEDVQELREVEAKGEGLVEYARRARDYSLLAHAIRVIWLARARIKVAVPSHNFYRDNI